MKAVAIYVAVRKRYILIAQILTITPLPKYFAVSKARFGTLAPSHLVRLESTGKSAPSEDPARITKMDAIRSARSLWSPPPEPQLVESSSRRISLLFMVGVDSGRSSYVLTVSRGPWTVSSGGRGTQGWEKGRRMNDLLRHVSSPCRSSCKS